MAIYTGYRSALLIQINCSPLATTNPLELVRQRTSEDLGRLYAWNPARSLLPSPQTAKTEHPPMYLSPAQRLTWIKLRSHPEPIIQRG